MTFGCVVDSVLGMGLQPLSLRPWEVEHVQLEPPQT